MTRFRMRPEPTAQVGGETLTIAGVNDRIVRLADELARSQPALEALLAEQQAVALEYSLRYAAHVATSEAASEDRRKAAAEVAMANTRLEGDEVSLAERRSVLDMRVRAMREAHHNIRAQLSGLQSVASNLRAEHSTAGMRP